MKRFLTCLLNDIRLQIRNGFYVAAGLAVVVMLLLFKQIPNLDFGTALPIVVFMNMMVGTFYFIGALMMLEKGEGTLEALVVTPMKPSDYLLSKIASLGLLTLLEASVVIGVVFGMPAHLIMVFVGTLILVMNYILLGFLMAARYDSVNEFIFPSILATCVLVAPILIDFFSSNENFLLFIHPLFGGYFLLKNGFIDSSSNLSWLALSSAVIWCSILFLQSKRSFYRYLVRKEGIV